MLLQSFIRERMDMMQKPFVAMDAFETKAMEHAERGRGVKATILDSFTRVKEADARAVFSRWTKKGMTFGRKAAEKMGKGVQRAKGALGKGLEGSEWSRTHLFIFYETETRKNSHFRHISSFFLKERLVFRGCRDCRRGTFTR